MSNRNNKRTRKNLFKGLPRKGTKRREILRMLLRPEGVTTYEASEIYCDFKSNLTQFSDERGWDIREFPCKDCAKCGPNFKKHGREMIYKIAGRVRPNRYRALSNLSLTDR